MKALSVQCLLDFSSSLCMTYVLKKVILFTRSPMLSTFIVTARINKTLVYKRYIEVTAEHAML